MAYSCVEKDCASKRSGRMNPLTYCIGPTLLVLGGCAGAIYQGETYGNARKTDVTAGETSFVVYDRPDLNSLYVRPGGIGSALSQGANPGTQIIKLKLAAQTYLKDIIKKDCVTDEGKEIMAGQFEFKYNCK